MIPRIVAGSNAVCTNLAGRQQELIELQMIVAKGTGDWGAAGKVLGNKGTHDLFFEAVLSVDEEVRNAEVLGHLPRVVDVVDRATAPLNDFGHTLASCQPALVP